MLGVFAPPKNHTFLLKIFSEFKRIEPSAKLMLVGGGDREPDIIQEAERLGIISDVIFTGVRADVNELMQAMDVFVLPSLYEAYRSRW